MLSIYYSVVVFFSYGLYLLFSGGVFQICSLFTIQWLCFSVMFSVYYSVVVFFSYVLYLLFSGCVFQLCSLFTIQWL